MTNPFRQKTGLAAGNRPLALLLLITLLFGPFATAASAQEPVAPETTPDAATGLDLFGERCANCHGPLGRGDGEMADRLSRPPASLSSEAYMRSAVPARMFDTITNGVLPTEADAGMPPMPPFGPASSNPIAEANRWDLIAAIYSMGTTPTALESGAALYEESCQECHGEGGDAASFNLTDPAYWTARSNQEVFDLLAAGEESVAEHNAYELEQEALWDVVSYARTFSYDYADPFVAFAPIEAAVITGTVTNETSGDVVVAGTLAELNAFTANFEPALTMTTTVDENGTFAFNVTQVDPELVYVVTVDYEGISFSSDFGQISRQDPRLALPVPVFGQTTDPSTVSVGQLHLILEFTEEEVSINELYQFSQSAQAVFIGEEGDPEEGTVRLALPDGATVAGFDRTFGAMDSFFPAENMVQTGSEWADTLPLRPGQGTLSLLARYTLPYEEGMAVSHPVHYDVNVVNLVLADVGVTLSEDGPWQAQDAQSVGGGVFLSYSRGGLAGGEDLSFVLEGEPQPEQIAAASAAMGNAGNTAQAPRDETNELLIGAGVLLLAVAAGAYLVYLWQRQQLEPAAAAAPAAVEASVPADVDDGDLRETLLLEIAALDDAYEAGELEPEIYETRRKELKERLTAVWT